MNAAAIAILVEKGLTAADILAVAEALETRKDRTGAERQARYYNEAILVTAVGSLPIRVGKQFKAGRKLGKTHQNMLVFCKGDPRRAAQACEGQ